MTTILTGILGGAVLIAMVFGLVLWAMGSSDDEADIRKDIEKWRDGK